MIAMKLGVVVVVTTIWSRGFFQLPDDAFDQRAGHSTGRLGRRTWSVSGRAASRSRPHDPPRGGTAEGLDEVEQKKHDVYYAAILVRKKGHLSHSNAMQSNARRRCASIPGRRQSPVRVGSVALRGQDRLRCRPDEGTSGIPSRMSPSVIVAISRCVRSDKKRAADCGRLSVRCSMDLTDGCFPRQTYRSAISFPDPTLCESVIPWQSVDRLRTEGSYPRFNPRCIPRRRQCLAGHVGRTDPMAR